MTDTKLPTDKEILTAANQLLEQYEDVQQAKLHAALESDRYLEEGDIDGHLLWLKIRRAILELTEVERDEGETVH